MEVVTAVVGSVAGRAADYAVAPARHVGYFFNYKSHCEELKAQLEELMAARERLKLYVDEALRNGENIFYDIETWLTEVNGKISAAVAEQLVEDEKKRCFAGLCPNFVSRYRISKKAEKESNSIAVLLKKAGAFDRVSYRPASQVMVARPVRDYMEFESRRGAFAMVMEALKDADLSMIGVYGMSGVGKTVLVKQVARQAMEGKMFDTVVTAIVTQNPNMQHVQNQIADMLGVRIDEQSMEVTAVRLIQRLKKEKKVLVILDDVWSPLDLLALGVPFGDEHKGCKILITSRDDSVLSSMHLQKLISVDNLTEDEAWQLFKKNAGDVVERSDIQSTAVEVAKKCAGLPLAIVTVARALKDRNQVFQWKDALETLKGPSKEGLGGIPRDVYSAIDLSYRHLDSEEVQLTFLLCSIMGDNAAIEDLLRLGSGFGLFRHLSKIEHVRNRVLRIVDGLIDSCLLRSGSTGYFDMHDIIHEFAVTIAWRDYHWLALETKEVSEYLSNEEKMQKCSLISFQSAKVSELPDELECPNLTFFSMGMGSDQISSLKIPINFFKGMQKLKVLYLAKMQFSSLPFLIDFGLLKSLRTLYLLDCKLEDIGIIGELTNLEILNLCNSRIEKLPREIGKLIRLKLLDMSDCDDLQVIPANVLSRLTSLEELYLYNSFERWELVEEGESPGSNASLVELQNLVFLTTLEVHVGDLKAVPKDTKFLGKLERYKISIGSKWNSWECESKSSGMLKLWHRWDKMFDDGLLRKVEILCLDEVDDVTNLEGMRYDEINVGSFRQLRVLQASGCKGLKNLFSFSIARELQQLEEIVVSDCEDITELIAEKGDQEEVLVFARLKRLKLEKLPKLNRLCGVGKNPCSSEQGRDQSIESGSNAWCLLDHEAAFPSLEYLKLSAINIEQLFSSVNPALNLRSLILESCNNLRYVMSPSMVKNFTRLRNLEISDCKIMEAVVDVEGLAAEEIMNPMFPSLVFLRLGNLPKFTRFYHGTSVISNLRKLWIHDCPSLVTFIFDSDTSSFTPSGAAGLNLQEKINDAALFNEKVDFPELEELIISSMPSFKIFNNQFAAKSFYKLSYFKVGFCENLSTVFPFNIVERLESLSELRIWNCDSLEEIFDPQNPSTEESHVATSTQATPERRVTISFPRLTYLQLQELPNLRGFCNNIYITQCPSLSKIDVQGCHRREPETPPMKELGSLRWTLEDLWKPW